MDTSFVLLILVIGLGLIFEFVNGFHDAANAIATIIATRVLSPLAAVLMAGALNFLGAVTGLAVAATVGAGLVDPSAVTLTTVASGLLAAILWDIATWFYGIPTSSSHALLFGILGAGVATSGVGAVIIGGVELLGIGIIYSPVIGLIAAGGIVLVIYYIFRHRRPTTVRKLFSRLQLLSSAYMAYSHGGNDGQKTMGIIALALFTYGTYDSFYVPLWVIIAAALAMGLGTAAGGFRIVRTLGFKLVKLDAPHGFAAETAAATVISGTRTAHEATVFSLRTLVGRSHGEHQVQQVPDEQTNQCHDEQEHYHPLTGKASQQHPQQRNDERQLRRRRKQISNSHALYFSCVRPEERNPHSPRQEV